MSAKGSGRWEDITCHICQTSDLPVAIREAEYRAKRKGKKKRGVEDTDWVGCEICKKWVHPFCCGLSKAEFTQIKSKDSFFKCIACCLSRFGSGVTSVYIECVKSKVLSSGESEVLPDELSQSLVSEGPVTDQVGGIGDKVSAVSSSAAQETGGQEEKTGEAIVELKLQGEKEIREKIVIVDDIPEVSDFRNSRDIVREIGRVSDQKIEFAYPLVKGGVAIHTSSVVERDKLLGLLKESSAFGGGKISGLADQRECTFFVKGVDTRVQESEIIEKFAKEEVEVLGISRISNSVSGRPTRTVKVVVAAVNKDRVSGLDLRIGQSKCRIEERRRGPVVRCYECQQFGHISRHCVADKCCVVCAGSHKSNFDCTQPRHCRNCGEGHAASDRVCAVYLRQYENLTKQYSVDKHVEDISESEH